MELKQLLVNENKNIIDAWKQMSKNAKKIVFCINDDGCLTGVLSDGDIRTQVVESEDIKTKIKDVMNKNFVYASDNDSKADILSKLKGMITIVPIVNNEFKPVDYFEYKIDTHIPIAIPNLGGNEFNYLMDAFLSTWISSKGDYILKFEKAFADYCSGGGGVPKPLRNSSFEWYCSFTSCTCCIGNRKG